MTPSGLLACLAVVAGAQPSPEAQLALTSLRDGEAARLSQQLGDVELPLYKADLALDVTARKLSGTVALTLTPAEPTDELFLRVPSNALHPEAISVGQLTVDGSPKAFTRPDPSLYRVAFAEPLPPGEPVQLVFKLGAKLPPPPAGGLGALNHAERTDYGAFSSSAEFTSIVGLFPMLVPRKPSGELRSAPSGIGDLGSFAPAHWLVSLTVPKRYMVIAPGVQLGELPDGKGTIRFAYACAAAREFPLLVFRGYELTQATHGGVSVEAWAPRRDRDAAARALKLAGQTLTLLQEKLGPYPWKKLRLVSAPLGGGAGGMEFPGLVTIADGVLHGADELARGAAGAGLRGSLGAMLSPLLGETLELSVAHEVAHQYFAMLVGSDAVDEPLADEALTQHVALLAIEGLRGKAAAEQMRQQQLKLAFQAHRLLGGPDGRADRSTTEFLNQLEYGALVYGKAPLLFDAQRALVGEAEWQAALADYVAQYRWKEATLDSLQDVVATRAPARKRALQALRVHWWEEAHGDEDLGSLAPDALLGGGGRAPSALDPRLLEQLDKAVRALAGE